MKENGREGRERMREKDREERGEKEFVRVKRQSERKRGEMGDRRSESYM